MRYDDPPRSIEIFCDGAGKVNHPVIELGRVESYPAIWEHWQIVGEYAHSEALLTSNEQLAAYKAGPNARAWRMLHGIPERVVVACPSCPNKMELHDLWNGKGRSRTFALLSEWADKAEAAGLIGVLRVHLTRLVTSLTN